MAVRRWTVTLDDSERAVFKDAADKRAGENVVRRLRGELNADIPVVAELATSTATLTEDQVDRVRTALTRRLRILHAVAQALGEDDAELIQTATQPIRHALGECERLLSEEFDRPAAAEPTTPTLAAVVP